MSEVKNNMDFIQLLGPDMSIKILTHLDDPCDLIRVSAVSSSWHRFVIEHGLCKQLCLKMFPEISGVAHIIELDNIIEPISNTLGRYVNWECLKRNHKVYAFLASGLTPMRKNCISKAISASSTDNYPEESILHTLEPGDRTEYRASYWSSKGESDPSVPETLVYKLVSKMCHVTEIHVQPFQAYFQHGFPIYSAKAVRFRMGHPRYAMELGSAVNNMAANHVLGDNQFMWTYTSPVFPMCQILFSRDDMETRIEALENLVEFLKMTSKHGENRLLQFKLPEPVLCIGGVLLVELLGRVQKQEMDELFYICISHVQVLGRPLSPAFDVKICDPSGKCTLKYRPLTDCNVSSSTSSPRRESSNPSRLQTITSSIMQRGLRRWEQIIMGALLGSGSVVVDD
ncbi:F-box protein [Spatholobus suberectus]|nr:F-box protein [Spatholobus suberectus]